MKIITSEYNEILQNPNVPVRLKEELANTSVKEGWSFIGTDFSGQENVNLAEMLYPYDGGRLADIIASGDKDK